MTNPTPFPDDAAKALPRRKRALLHLCVLLCVLLFAGAIARFYERGTGFTSLLTVGEWIGDQAIPAFRDVPHYVFNHSYGYDGSYYVQIALSPFLDDPALPQAIDNLPYRARRILLSWTAWVAGLGQPSLIVHVFPLLNVATWFALAWLLLRWFPPTSWNSFFRWFAVMFSQGVCMSVRNSLTDAPSLLLLATAVLFLQRGRTGGGVVALAAATLTKETSVLASAAFQRFESASPRGWRRTALLGGLVALPLVLWLAYIRWKIGADVGEGKHNFTAPLAGLGEKWAETVTALVDGKTTGLEWSTAACVLGLTVQCAFCLSRWRPADIWWRAGVPFAVMALFLSKPVWEGWPGAAPRVLLPLTLAFNVLVPRGARWLPVLIAGNLSFIGSFAELTPPARFYQFAGPSQLADEVSVKAVGGWYGIEQRGASTWRWSSGEAGLQFKNQASTPLLVTVEGSLTALAPGRHVEIRAGDQALWTSAVSPSGVKFRFACRLAPGETLVQFTTNTPAPPEDQDRRRLAFSVSNLKLTLASEPASP
ncbi:MAG TPA: hypothetical protein VEQ65_00845 [Opitutus sp.]|nr:hypothetical protein [Opitutus sp.]